MHSLILWTPTSLSSLIFLFFSSSLSFFSCFSSLDRMCSYFIPQKVTETKYMKNSGCCSYTNQKIGHMVFKAAKHIWTAWWWNLDIAIRSDKIIAPQTRRFHKCSLSTQIEVKTPKSAMQFLYLHVNNGKLDKK